MEELEQQVSKETTDEKQTRSQKSIKKKIGFKIALILIVLVVLLGIFIWGYFANTISSVRVVGNEFLDDDYVSSLLDVEIGDRYLIIRNWLDASTIEEDEKIDNCTISLNGHHELVITIEENTIVGYTVSQDGTSKFLLADGTIIDFNSSYIKNLALIPLVLEYEEDFTAALATRLGLLETDVLTHISEIAHISFTYDENMVKLTMDEGYYVYTSLEGLPYLNYYLDIIAQDTNVEKGCLLIAEDEEKALIMDCETLESYRDDLD